MMMIVELHAFARHLIEMRCFQEWVAVIADITVTLIICDDEDDVGMRSHFSGPKSLRV